MIAVYSVAGTSATEQLLLPKMANTITLSEEALIVDSIEDRAMVGRSRDLT